MQESDKPDFAQIMTILSETFDKPVTTPTIEIYFEILKPFTIRQIKWALKKILMEWSYRMIPPPAEFVKRLDVYRLDEYDRYAMPESHRNEIKALGDPIPLLRDNHILTDREEKHPLLEMLDKPEDGNEGTSN